MTQNYLDNLKISKLNDMQLAVISAAEKSNDILLLSPTGSGKTLGFLLPVITRLDDDLQGVQALVIVPSRELALQIEQVFKQMNTGFKVNCCYGGHSTKIERNNLSHPPALLVGTPGRIAYHLKHQHFETNNIHTLVLDEFDKALELGFKDEMSSIISKLKIISMRILTSATNMPEIPSFTGVTNIKELNFLGTESPVKDELRLKYIQAEDKDKLQILFSLLCMLQNKPALVFCNHREAVDRISTLLFEKGIAHGIFHGGMEQEDRERSLIKFRNGSHRLLITTDLASRGLDIPEIEAVIHYQLPLTEDIYTHRNGRTARMNATGTAYLLLSAADQLPPFLKTVPEEEILPKSNTLPGKPAWTTLYIAAGKKDKINKMDIVGALLQKGGIEKEDLGKVEVLDHSSYAAINTSKVKQLLSTIVNEKIKNRKIKIELSR